MAVDIGVPGITDAVQIGQGGFGKVYRAHQEDLNRDVAVKVLTNVDLDAEARQRFTREARAIGRLSGHPNVVDVYAQGMTTDDAPYLIMELCTGGSLGDRVKQGQHMSWQEATEDIVAIAGALQTAHAVGILHRDIKPANLLVDSYGTAKLADFGIAHVGSEASMTATGMMAGSPAHIAPELVMGQKPTPASDVYSMASTLFALITGNAPFVRDGDTSILTLIQRITNEPPPHLTQWGVPGPMADLVAAAMSKKPEGRPQSVDEFARGLMAVRRQLGLPPGEYRVQRAPGAVDSDLTMVPPSYPQPSQRGPQQPSPAGGFNFPPPPTSPGGPGAYAAGPSTTPTAPVPAWSSPPPAAGRPPGPPLTAAATAGVPATASNRGAIIACWAIVAVCTILIAWMLIRRAQLVQASAPLLSLIAGS
ncbi:serine/threonine-protein kinase [Granulicoccus sp. GXG6511]|uniref:serine/threonine-protein kinase n=1 Tax=Granulicoccus sp. GXG6511 TaxID=3381351 RepID=UPI003D7E5B63